MRCEKKKTNTVNGNPGNSTDVSYLPVLISVEDYVWSLRRKVGAPRGGGGAGERLAVSTEF